MGKKSRKVYIVGHKNPDTDSICSAIAYAELKRRVTGDDYVAKRAGQINEETHYVLKKFKMDAPGLLQNVKLQKIWIYIKLTVWSQMSRSVIRGIR